MYIQEMTTEQNVRYDLARAQESWIICTRLAASMAWNVGSKLLKTEPQNSKTYRKVDVYIQQLQQRINGFGTNYLFDFSTLALVCMMKTQEHGIYFIPLQKWNDMCVLWAQLLLHHSCIAIATEGIRLWRPGNWTGGEVMVYKLARPISASSWDYGTSHIGDQRRLSIRAVSPESSLFAHIKCESRWRVQAKIRYLAPLMTAHACLKNEFTEGEKYHNLMTWLICCGNRDLYSFNFCYGMKCIPCSWDIHTAY